MTIPTLTDVVEEPRNQWHEQLLRRVEGEAVETHYEREVKAAPELDAAGHIVWW